MIQWRRMTLRRADGRVYLDRWGFGHKRIGAVFLHRMEAPDPGLDLHDHPWTFISLVLSGGYSEERALTRVAPALARACERWPAANRRRGLVEYRRRWSIRRMRLDECHRVTSLLGDRCWTLVLCGPVRRRWGFYLSDGYMDERTYDDTVRVHRRDLWAEGGYVESRLADQPPES